MPAHETRAGWTAVGGGRRAVGSARRASAGEARTTESPGASIGRSSRHPRARGLDARFAASSTRRGPHPRPRRRQRGEPKGRRAGRGGQIRAHPHGRVCRLPWPRRRIRGWTRDGHTLGARVRARRRVHEHGGIVRRPTEERRPRDLPRGQPEASSPVSRQRGGGQRADPQPMRQQTPSAESVGPTAFLGGQRASHGSNSSTISSMIGPQ